HSRPESDRSGGRFALSHTASAVDRWQHRGGPGRAGQIHGKCHRLPGQLHLPQQQVQRADDGPAGRLTMSLDRIFDIAGSGMNAQAVRLIAVAVIIASAVSVYSSIDQTYRARLAVFSTLFNDQQQALGGFPSAADDLAGQGVSVLDVVKFEAELQALYDPD